MAGVGVASTSIVSLGRRPWKHAAAIRTVCPSAEWWRSKAQRLYVHMREWPRATLWGDARHVRRRDRLAEIRLVRGDQKLSARGGVPIIKNDLFMLHLGHHHRNRRRRGLMLKMAPLAAEMSEACAPAGFNAVRVLGP